MNDVQSTFQEGHLIRGQYRVIDLLGRGASGAVYLVTDERDQQKQFALKEVVHAVRKERGGSLFDAAALKQLSHPALPRIYWVFPGDNHDRSYILMDYVAGYSLEVMRQLMPGKRFSLHAAMTLMSPIMDALSYLHRQHPPQTHGDIKPSNIIPPIPGTLDPSKLVDFGGGNNLDSDATAGQNALNFRAPEQFGGRASRRSDVYALGATFYTLLTGAPPAAASERLAHMGAGEPDPLLPMHHFMSSSQIVEDAIHSALSINRRDRFASVELFREALWQVIYANQKATQLPELTMVVPAREHTGALLPEPMLTPPIEGNDAGGDPNPDEPLLEVEIPGVTVKANRRPQGTFAAASSELPRSLTMPGEGKPPVAVSSREGLPVTLRMRRRKRKGMKFSSVVFVFLVVCIIGSGVAFDVSQTAYTAQYQKDAALAQVGIKHLQAAISLLQAWSKKPPGTQSVAPAQNEFAAAAAVFAQLETDVQSFSGVARLIPFNAATLNAASRIVPVAMKIAHAGVVGCAALNLIIAKLRAPLGSGRDLSNRDLTVISNDFRQVEADVNFVTVQVNSLQPGDLQFDPRIGKAIAAFHRYLPPLLALLRETDQLLPVLPAVLGMGAPASYLVEILDSSQLRPGGGFIKDYGFATFIRGRWSATNITDAHLLDTHYSNTGQTLSLPSKYGWFDLTSNKWNLRDSNLDADFPTVARYAEQNYNLEGGQAPLQGVMAITTTLMSNVLALTGPIRVPELNEYVTAQNLLSRIHNYEPWLGNQGGSGSILRPNQHFSGSRYFTGLLAQYFLARFHQVRSTILPALFQLLVSSMRTKDLQIYFDDPAAEHLLQLSHVDAAIQAPPGDSLFVVDANIAADNANQFLTNTLDDRVTIDGSGNAVHHTTIRYAWLKNGFVFGSPLYSDYTRVYVPPGSSLQEQHGWQPGGASVDFRRQVWAGSFTLSQGQTNSVTLTWTDKGVAKKDGAGWHYQYLVQRQAGTQWSLNVQVTLPACATRTHTSGGLISHNGQMATLTQSLTEDTNLGVDYSC